MPRQLDFEDIQALLFTGYGRLRRARYAFFQVRDAAAARRWLGSLADEVMTEARLQASKPHGVSTAVHVAFTSQGLSALGLPDEVLRTFPTEFVQGMAHPDRARLLGDTGHSAPSRWQFGGTDEEGRADPRKELHLVLMLFTDDDLRNAQERRDFHERYCGSAEARAHGVRLVFLQDTYLATLDGKSFKESFGFSDGITQAGIEGYAPASTHGMTLKPGEVILGYDNAYGQRPLSPTVPARLDAGDVLPEVPRSALRDLGCNGSFMVIRKLWQNLEAFNAFLEKHGQDAREREWLAAKLVGRWRSGAPLAMSPEHDDVELGEDRSRNNTFGYAQDPQGLRCPLGSHIRRANPRDGLIPGDPRTSLEVVARHQLVRRGRSYEDGTDGSQTRGLFFVALNASFKRQFEFIQHTWLNSTKFAGQYDGKDPIAGDHPDATDGAAPGRVTIPDFPVCRRIDGLTRFVEVQGGGYFFLPGLRALRFLGELEAPTLDAPGRRGRARLEVLR
jgi:Dyp-type peroxidase family